MEPILDPKNNRLDFLDIQYHDIWEMRQKHKSSFWTAEEVDIVPDLNDWNEKLNNDEKHFIKLILAFFYRSDFIVNENLAETFMSQVQIPELSFYYTFQMMMETEHSLMYGLLLNTYISDRDERQFLIESVETVPVIKQKAEWARKWIKEGSFSQRLVAFAIVEGIFFSGSFCAIFWLKKRGLMPGLCISNEWIARDEGLHRDLACLVYSKYIVNKLDENELKEIIKEAVELEKNFICETLKVSLIGMNSDLMNTYIEYTADHLCMSLINKTIYNSLNPFPWMNMISLEGKTNFFEHKVTQYSKNAVLANKEENLIRFDSDF